jgi:hypothetical protein
MFYSNKKKLVQLKILLGSVDHSMAEIVRVIDSRVGRFASAMAFGLDAPTALGRSPVHADRPMHRFGCASDACPPNAHIAET